MKFLWNYSDTLFPLLVLPLLLKKHLRPEGYRLLIAYLVCTVIIKGVSNLLADHFVNNMFLYHFYSLLELCLLLPMVKIYSRIAWKPVVWTIALFAIFCVVDVLIWESLNQFNSNSASIAALLVTGYCLLYFLKLIKDDRVMNFQIQPSFWIVSGFLFYSIASILVLGSYKYTNWFSDSDSHVIWRIEQTANIIKFVLIATGVLCSYRLTSRDGSS